MGAENNIKDLNYIAELRGKQSFIDIDVQGALSGNAKKNFKGTIDFKKGCKKRGTWLYYRGNLILSQFWFCFKKGKKINEKKRN